jgi:hypothetical protein
VTDVEHLGEWHNEDTPEREYDDAHLERVHGRLHADDPAREGFDYHSHPVR